MKIIIPVVGFGKAGGERVLSKLATELKNFGHDVVFIAPEHSGEPYYQTSATVKYSKFNKQGSKVARFFSRYFNLWRACLREKPDAVIANLHLVAYLVALLPIATSKKFYYIQAYEVMFGQNNLSRLIAYVTYLLPLRKIVNHKDLLPKKINNIEGVVPAGIDLNLFRPELPVRSEPVRCIGIIGRKERHKGTNETVDLICNLKITSNITLNVAIYLSDENKQKLEKAKINWNYYDIACDEELSTFYKRNQLVIATGLIEDGAFHYPCAEAMACGCLVISNYAPLIDTSSNFSIPTFDSDIITTKIEKAFSLKSEELDHEIQQNMLAVSQYSWDVVGRKLNAILHK